jgi:hypothetical protein
MREGDNWFARSKGYVWCVSYPCGKLGEGCGSFVRSFDED